MMKRRSPVLSAERQHSSAPREKDQNAKIIIGVSISIRIGTSRLVALRMR
jgi:hypothetical protein